MNGVVNGTAYQQVDATVGARPMGGATQARASEPPQIVTLAPTAGLERPRPGPAQVPDTVLATSAFAKGAKDLVPGQCATPSDKAAKALDKVLDAAANQATARKMGVDLAKADYFNKTHNVAVAFTNFVLTALLTAATGGVALPLLVLTGVRLMVATADMACARKCVKDAEYELEHGKPAPDRLPMGASGVGNLMFWALKSLNVGDDKARLAATTTACVVSVGLSLSMLFTALYSAPAFAFTEGLCRMGSSMAGGLLGLYEYGYVGFWQVPAQARRLDEARHAIALTQQFVEGLPAQDRAWLARQLQDINGQGASKEIDELLGLAKGEWAPAAQDARQAVQSRRLENVGNAERLGTRAYFLIMGSKSVFEACQRIATLA